MSQTSGSGSGMLDWESIEALAGIGCWTFDPVSGEMSWTSGLRTLLSLATDTPAQEHAFLARFAEPGRLATLLRVGGGPLRVTTKGEDGRWLDVTVVSTHANGRRPASLFGVARDVSELRTAERELQKQSAYLRGILSHLPQGITVFDETLRLKYWNDRATEVLGLPHEMVVSDVPFEDLIKVPAQRGEYGDGDPAELVRQRRELALRFEAHRFERTRPNGRSHLVIGEPMYIDGRIAGFITTYTDITDRKATEREIERQNQILESIIQNIPCGVTLFDRDLKLISYNEEIKRLLDFPDDLFSKPGLSLVDLFEFNARRGEYGEGDADEIVHRLTERARSRQPHSFERERPDGRVIHVRGQPLPDGSFVTIYNDITEHKRREAEVAHLAHHDVLTGLANRFSLHARLEQSLAEARRNGYTLAVLFLDLDRFKNVNDSLGHHHGDALLVEVGKRLSDSVRASDAVARLGGDEFVVVAQDVAGVNGATHVATHIMERLSAPYSVGEVELHAIPSIGISMYPGDGESPEALLRNADAAMYHAKALGRGNFQFFTEQLNVAATERLRLEAKLRKAVIGDEFELWYQPLFELRDDEATPCGVEALLRWRTPDGNLVSPGEFIPLAEETGMIIPIGDWVISEACRQIARWQADGLGGLRIAINLSARQLRDSKLPERIVQRMSEYGLAAGAIEFEITESSVMEEPTRAIAVLDALKATGAALAIDDFGTGYSSLSYLKLFPLDRLKIDRSFVSDIEHDADDAAIVGAAVSLAHNLGLRVVAEGVETATQLERLRQLGCDELQGYHLCRPMPAGPLEAWLRDRAAAERR